MIAKPNNPRLDGDRPTGKVYRLMEYPLSPTDIHNESYKIKENLIATGCSATVNNKLIQNRVKHKTGIENQIHTFF